MVVSCRSQTVHVVPSNFIQLWPLAIVAITYSDQSIFHPLWCNVMIEGIFLLFVKSHDFCWCDVYPAVVLLVEFSASSVWNHFTLHHASTVLFCYSSQTKTSKKISNYIKETVNYLTFQEKLSLLLTTWQVKISVSIW